MSMSDGNKLCKGFIEVIADLVVVLWCCVFSSIIFNKLLLHKAQDYKIILKDR